MFPGKPILKTYFEKKFKGTLLESEVLDRWKQQMASVWKQNVKDELLEGLKRDPSIDDLVKAADVP